MLMLLYWWWWQLLWVFVVIVVAAAAFYSAKLCEIRVEFEYMLISVSAEWERLIGQSTTTHWLMCGRTFFVCCCCCCYVSPWVYVCECVCDGCMYAMIDLATELKSPHQMKWIEVFVIFSSGFVCKDSEANYDTSRTCKHTHASSSPAPLSVCTRAIFCEIDYNWMSL